MSHLRPLDEAAFTRAVTQARYLEGRWVYLKHVARFIEDLAPHTVLEIGVGPVRFVPGSATLDIDPNVEPTYLRDAGVVPWPIPDGAFELVTGLQCWEHFEGSQAPAFLEALRVAGPSGHVLLSLPYRWENTTRAHRGIDELRIREWTSGRHAVRRLHVEKPEHRQRLILLFRGEAC